MADTILKFKPITSDDVYMGIDKTYSSQTTKVGTDISWYYIERENATGTGSSYDDLDNDLLNLFHSFGLSRQDEEDWFRVTNVEDWYNAKRAVVAVIPQEDVGSYVDGSTLRINVPTGTGSSQYTTFYGSTFGAYPDPETGKQLSLEYQDAGHGGATCYLFANTAGSGALPTGTYETGTCHPYTGTINGAINPNAGEGSFDWDGTKGLQRHLSATHWSEGDNGKDVPYGVALLERGIFVIFDFFNRTDFIANCNVSSSTIWNSNLATFSAVTNTGGTFVQNSNTANRNQVSFVGANAETNAMIQYRTITQSYKNVYFCHASPSEFNSTTNHTYNHKEAYYRPEESDSLWVTEVGLYDDTNTLLAYAKLSEPVEKNRLETLTFKVELQL